MVIGVNCPTAMNLNVYYCWASYVLTWAARALVRCVLQWGCAGIALQAWRIHSEPCDWTLHVVVGQNFQGFKRLLLTVLGFNAFHRMDGCHTVTWDSTRVQQLKLCLVSRGLSIYWQLIIWPVGGSFSQPDISGVCVNAALLQTRLCCDNTENEQ